MCLYINVGSFKIPAYGFMIAIGVIIANIVAVYILSKKRKDINNFILLEAYCFLGAFLGAKSLYLIVSFKDIEWKKLVDIVYFNKIMQGGFVFYGGLIGGIIFIFLFGNIHKINAVEYLRDFVFLIPFIHAFGRIGCFMAGCCYGIPYNGIGNVVFPENSMALSGISLFPVQLVEAIILLIISMVVFVLRFKRKTIYSIEIYFILYGITRFVLEYFRYDDLRGHFLLLSTSQWISIVLLVIAGGFIIFKRKIQ